MAFQQLAVAVTDVRVLALGVGTSTNGFPSGKFICRNYGTEIVYVGNDAVTAADGLPVKAGELLSVSALAPHDKLYAVCDAGKTTSLRFLWTAPN